MPPKNIRKSAKAPIPFHICQPFDTRQECEIAMAGENVICVYPKHIPIQAAYPYCKVCGRACKYGAQVTREGRTIMLATNKFQRQLMAERRKENDTQTT